MGILISIGKWGGVYAHTSHDFSWRICLGWIAFTLFFFDGDEILKMAAEGARHGKETT
jgi:hypothetical protein